MQAMGLLGFPMTTLPDAIAYIVSIGPKEEVRGPNAGRIIAMMTDEEPFWNRTDHLLEGETMG